MKKSYIFSGLVGGAFFGVAYLGLSIPLAPAIVTAGVSYIATTLLFKDKNKLVMDYSLDKDNIYNLIKQGREEIKQIEAICKMLENASLVENVKGICAKANAIIDILSKKPEKLNSVYNFLNYYLPVTIKILIQYDEVENNKLTSAGSKDFMKKVENLIVNINKAFEKQLNNMYENEIINTEADIKVFESLLKTDRIFRR